MEIIDVLTNAKLLTMPFSADDRGTFIKAYNEDLFRNEGIDFTLRESYFSSSKQNVIRGMHFQIPPFQHSKIVFCIAGAVLDVIVDLRKGSPSYGQYFAYELSAKNRKAHFIPEGYAHGFLSLTDDSITYYLVSSCYDKQHDAGIRYDSIGFDWSIGNPILSARDMSFTALKDFDSPFVY